MKQIEIIDNHCHLNDNRLINQVDRVISDSKEFGVSKMICIGYDLESSKKAVELANKYKEVYATVGIHPDYADKYTKQDLEEIEKIAKDPKVLAIGEIGLDYYWHKDQAHQELQKELFISQIQIANKVQKPINIHTREATLDTIEILKENETKYGKIMHCCPLNNHLIKETLKLGAYISFSGIVTFKNADPRSSVLLVPDDRLLVETDSPYLAPQPKRGDTNIPRICVLHIRENSRDKTNGFRKFKPKSA